jgi:hypothetical protein
MEIVLWQLLGIPLFGWTIGNFPFDVAPPVTEVVGLSAVAISALCAVTLVIAGVGYLVIRAIKKNQAGKNQP